MKMFMLILSEAWESLNAHRMRSFLTMLGIIIGVCAVILTLVIGKSIRDNVQKSMQRLGTNVIMISSIQTGNSGSRGRDATSLKFSDVQAIAELPDVAAVAPITISMMQVISADGNWNAMVNGTVPDIQKIRNYVLQSGEMFSDIESDSGARVAVLGKSLADKLFPTTDAVGNMVRMQNANLRVIGVLKGSGRGMGGMDMDM